MEKYYDIKLLVLLQYTVGVGIDDLSVLKDFAEEQVSLFGRLGSLPLLLYVCLFAAGRNN